MLDVFRAAELAGPPAIRKLPRGVSVEGGNAIKGDLLKRRLQFAARANFVAQRLEGPLQDFDPKVTGRRRLGPVDAWLPPVCGVARRPGDAVVVGGCRTGDAVVLWGQSGKVFVRDHA